MSNHYPHFITITGRVWIIPHFLVLSQHPPPAPSPSTVADIVRDCIARKRDTLQQTTYQAFNHLQLSGQFREVLLNICDDIFKMIC